MIFFSKNGYIHNIYQSAGKISMAINAINSLSARYSGYAQIDVEHEEIKKKLMALGQNVSGNKAIDKSRLEQAQKEQELENAQKTASEQSKSNTAIASTEEETEPDEFISLLSQIYVSKTGDVEADYRSAINELRSRFLTETSSSELSFLRNIKDNLDRIMSQLGYSTTSIASSEMSGATALGEMNKVMMLSAGGFSSSGK